MSDADRQKYKQTDEVSVLRQRIGEQTNRRMNEVWIRITEQCVNSSGTAMHNCICIDSIRRQQRVWPDFRTSVSCAYLFDRLLFDWWRHLTRSDRQSTENGWLVDLCHGADQSFSRSVSQCRVYRPPTSFTRTDHPSFWLPSPWLSCRSTY